MIPTRRPAPTPGTPRDLLKVAAPRERARVDGSDHGGSGEATPTREGGSPASGGDGGGSSD